MPYGLKNASPYFQQVMDAELSDIPFGRCYIDDIIVFSNSAQEHEEHVKAVLQRLRQCGLKAHPGKCKFAYQTIEYLGHMVTPDGVEPQQAKVVAIKQMPRPGDVAGLRAFLGLVNYYRRFCANLSQTCQPLYRLLKKEARWEWTEEQENAWCEAKQLLMQQPVLQRPDFNKKFILHTDWSVAGLGAVLAQLGEDGSEHVIAYASRSNNDAERNYSAYYEGECFVLWAVRHFRPYLHGREFVIVTDHQPLHWLLTNTKLSGKLARWALQLSEYNMCITHRAGKNHDNADALSRAPVEFDKQQSHVAPSMALATFAAGVAALPKEVALEESGRDVWHSPKAMAWLKEGKEPGSTTEAQQGRWAKMLHRYQWQDGKLWLAGKDKD